MFATTGDCSDGAFLKKRATVIRGPFALTDKFLVAFVRSERWIAEKSHQTSCTRFDTVELRQVIVEYFTDFLRSRTRCEGDCGTVREMTAHQDIVKEPFDERVDSSDLPYHFCIIIPFRRPNEFNSPPLFSFWRSIFDSEQFLD